MHVYDCVFKSVYLGSSVFLVPFLNFASKFIVKWNTLTDGIPVLKDKVTVKSSF